MPIKLSLLALFITCLVAVVINPIGSQLWWMLLLIMAFRLSTYRFDKNTLQSCLGIIAGSIFAFAALNALPVLSLITSGTIATIVSVGIVVIGIIVVESFGRLKTFASLTFGALTYFFAASFVYTPLPILIIECLSIVLIFGMTALLMSLVKK